MEELSIETNAPTEYGKYVDECLNEAAKHFFSEGKDKYTVADLFYAGIKCKEDWLEKQDEQQDKGEISDGYHTFNELYYYRMLYNAAFFNILPKEWVHKSKKHNDGEDCFGGGWFIVMANLPTGQISNHYELKDWDLFQIPEKEVADRWDGHTPQEAADRIYKYLLRKQVENKSIQNKESGKFECPNIKINDAIEVSSRMKYIDDDLKPIAEFILDYANWDLDKDEWSQPTLTVPVFRVLDALIHRGKPYRSC